PWIAASAYVIVLGMVMAWRFEGGAWQQIDLLGRGAGRAGTGQRPVPAVETAATSTAVGEAAAHAPKPRSET
ncbi:unnamed protein product, partial [marine sediment metagenome]